MTRKINERRLEETPLVCPFNSGIARNEKRGLFTPKHLFRKRDKHRIVPIQNKGFEDGRHGTEDGTRRVVRSDIPTGYE